MNKAMRRTPPGMGIPETAFPRSRSTRPGKERSTEELIERARRAYLRAQAFDQHGIPAELASTLALVPALCRELERLQQGQRRTRTDSRTSRPRPVEEERDRVLRVVAHELRNRLNSPRLHLRMLEKTFEAHEDEPRRLSELLISGIESAASVVDDIASLLSNPTDLRVPLRSLILELVHQHAARAAELGVTLEAVEPLSPDCFPRCGLKLVLENLILNAIEHHDERSDRWARISTRRRDDGISVLVEDNGPGLPRAVEDLLLGRTVDRRKRLRNSGIGLTVVKRAVDSLGARLELLQAEEAGTRVVVHLQVAP